MTLVLAAGSEMRFQVLDSLRSVGKRWSSVGRDGRTWNFGRYMRRHISKNAKLHLIRNVQTLNYCLLQSTLTLQQIFPILGILYEGKSECLMWRPHPYVRPSVRLWPTTSDWPVCRTFVKFSTVLLPKRCWPLQRQSGTIQMNKTISTVFSSALWVSLELVSWKQNFTEGLNKITSYFLHIRLICKKKSQQKTK
jgi:hypothetical protein